MPMYKNLFATVLTYAAPSSNYRGPSQDDRTILQKITRGGHEHTVISPEAMRSAMREVLARKGMPMNRRRLHDQGQPAVEFREFPNADKYADDFLFGFLVADPQAIDRHKELPPRRRSILRMNMAVSVTPYRLDATVHQAPANAGTSPWKSSPALIHREVSYTAYQYPFALSLADCARGNGPAWTAVLLECIGELTGVAGGHAHSYFEMSPRSMVVRLTDSLVAGFDTYGFREDGSFPELSRVHGVDLPGQEFRVAGALARSMPADERNRFESEGVRFYESPQFLLATLAESLFEAGA